MLVRAELDRVFEGAEDFHGEALHIKGLAAIGEDGEFVAADTRDQGAERGALAQALTGFNEAGVAMGMAKGVVDGFKVIEVDKDQGADRNAVSLAMEIFKPRIEKAAIGKTGQDICFGQNAGAFSQVLFFGDVLLHPKDPPGLTVDAIDGCGDAHPARIALGGDNLGIEIEIAAGGDGLGPQRLHLPRRVGCIEGEGVVATDV